MMLPIFQLFEFGYPNGFLFYDRSGVLSKRLGELLPGLALKNTLLDQRDFNLPESGIELYFGIRASHIRTLTHNDEDFPTLARKFLALVGEVFELSHLNEFRFRVVFARPCRSEEEAEKLMWPLVPQDAKEKLQALPEVTRWNALQAEFQTGALACVSRIAIMQLPPHESSGIESASAPHITFHGDFRGLATVPLAGFDAEAFMRHVRENQAKEILAKLAPHLELV